jgi:1,4-dihydroxy-2-naphthoate polyprenyltransferase
MKIKVWIQALRVFSFTTSIVPVLLCCALAYGRPNVNWYVLPFILFGALAALIASVMFNDHYDHANKIDSKTSFGSSRVLVDGLMAPRTLLAGARTALFIAAACGAYLIYLRGIVMFILVIAGLMAAYFYTGRPGYKYLALGDVAVFFMFGPLMMAGSYLALTGEITSKVLLMSLPVAFLVTAVVNGNNVRDLEHDKLAGIKTLPILVGRTNAIYIYTAIVLCAYISIPFLVLLGAANVWSFFTFITFPMAAGLFRDIRSKDQAKISVIDASSAKLHLAFGMIIIASVLFGK